MINIRKKRIIIIFSLLLFFICFIFYKKILNDKLEKFSDFIANYKKDISNYSIYNLNDFQERYTKLILEAEQTLSDKKFKNISSLTSDLNKLKKEIEEENFNMIKEIETYLDQYKKEISNYKLDDFQEGYDNLISEVEQIISNKDSKKIESLKYNLEQLKQEILNSNTEIINSNLSYIENRDISKLSNTDSINSQIEEIKKLESQNYLSKAIDLSSNLKEYIDEQLKIISEEEAKKDNEFTKRKAAEIFLANNPEYSDYYIVNENDNYSLAKNEKEYFDIRLVKISYKHPTKGVLFYSYSLFDLQSRKTIKEGYIYQDGTVGDRQ